jgi:hypothetical protein
MNRAVSTARPSRAADARLSLDSAVNVSVVRDAATVNKTERVE